MSESKPPRGRPRQTHCYMGHTLPETGRRDCKVCDRRRKEKSSPDAVAHADALRALVSERYPDEATITRILAGMDRRAEEHRKQEKESRLPKQERHYRRLIAEYAPNLGDDIRDEAAPLLAKLRKLDPDEWERLLGLLLMR